MYENQANQLSITFGPSSNIQHKLQGACSGPWTDGYYFFLFSDTQCFYHESKTEADSYDNTHQHLSVDRQTSTNQFDDNIGRYPSNSMELSSENMTRSGTIKEIHIEWWWTRPVTGTGKLAWQRLAHHIKNFNVKTLNILLTPPPTPTPGIVQ